MITPGRDDSRSPQRNRLVGTPPGPLFYFYWLRLIACIPAVVIFFGQDEAPTGNPVGAGLIVFGAVLGMAVATAYFLALRPYLAERRSIVRCPASIPDHL